MTEIDIKTPAEIEIMKQSGRKLGRVKNALRKMVKEAVSAAEIDEKASELIKKEGAIASFKEVPGYRWATCVNTNDGVVHGIPHPSIIFKKGDLVSVDVGLKYKGFHTDTSFTVAIEPNGETKRFLDAGREAFKKALKVVKPGVRVYDISHVIESTIEKYGYSPIQALVGHGVGRELHEEPQIPCFTRGLKKDSPELPIGATIAIEVMYTLGSPDVYIDSADKWTIRTKDGKIASLFEETVAVVAGGHLVLTE